MAQKPYKDYPQQYFQLLEDFSAKGQDITVDGEYSDMVYVRHDLNRFFKSLRIAAKQGDRYAEQLCNITRDITISLDPAHASRHSPAKVIIKVNPLVKAVRQHNPP